jgi:hypothetical protein
MGETTQPAPETDEKKSRGLGSYVLWAFVAVMVYVLSSGPATRLFGDQSAVLTVIYFPVAVLYNETPLHKPLGLYLHWWYPKGFTSDGDVRAK